MSKRSNQTRSNKIRSGINKNPDAVYADLSPQVEDATALKSSITIISEMLQQENELLQERKKLSRQVGAARKEGIDPSELIARISDISVQVKGIATGIDEKIAEIESVLGTVTDDNDIVPKWPAHLTPEQKPVAFDSTSLKLSHSDTIDVIEWQAFVDSVEHSTVYHCAVWCELIKSNFGHTPHYISCRKPDGELCGVLPTVHLESKLFGSFMVSMPYFNYGGPLSDYDAVDQLMLEYAAGLGKDLDCSHFEIRDTVSRDNWIAKQHKVTMILPMPESNQILDKQLGTKVRAQVNRAAKEDLEFSLGGEELLGEFYQVFSHNMRDLGTPVYDKKFFASILKAFPEKAHIAVVKHNSKPVAAGFLLGHRDKLEIPWASSLRKANPLGVNMYLYRQILRVSIEQGYAFFDFGRSSIGASTYNYKKQWGALEHPLHWHYWLKDADELPELNPDNPKYKIAISMWQRLPVPVANMIGPRLVRNLP